MKKHFLVLSIMVVSFFLIRCNESPNSPVTTATSQMLLKNANQTSSENQQIPIEETLLQNVKAYADFQGVYSFYTHPSSYSILERNSDGSWKVEFHGFGYYVKVSSGDRQVMKELGMTWFTPSDSRLCSGRKSGQAHITIPENIDDKNIDKWRGGYSVIIDNIPNGIDLYVAAYAQWFDGHYGENKNGQHFNFNEPLLESNLNGQNIHEQIDGMPNKLYPYTVNIQGGTPPYNCKWEVKKLNNSWETIANTSIGNNTNHSVEAGGISLIKCTITDKYKLSSISEIPIQNNIIYPQIMVGRLSMFGNEPFAEIGLDANGIVYDIDADQTILNQLYYLQGRDVRIYYLELFTTPFYRVKAIRYEIVN